MLPARIYVKNLADFKSFFRARPMRRAQNAPPPGRARALRTAEKKTGKMIANEGQSLWMVRYPIVPGPQWLEMVAPARSTRTSSK